MESNSTLSFIEKAKSFAIGAIGCGIFSLGTTYFSEQSIYRVPRILIPIFEIFGNIGLAIGMMILGAVLVYYAYSIFRKNKGNKLFFFVPILLFAIIFYFIIFCLAFIYQMYNLQAKDVSEIGFIDFATGIPAFVLLIIISTRKIFNLSEKLVYTKFLWVIPYEKNGSYNIP